MTERVYLVEVPSVQEKVYRTLRDDIVTLRMRPGMAISTQEIADRLGVSRTPVREAFLRLHNERLLDMEPQKKTVVSRIDLKRVYQERFIRESLEVQNLPRFISMATPEDLAAMRDNLAQQREQVAANNTVAYTLLDNAFHQIPLEATQEYLAASIIRDMNGSYDRVRLLTTWEAHIVQNALREHELLLDYIERWDVDAATRMLRDHLQRLWVQEKTLRERYPDYFKKD